MLSRRITNRLWRHHLPLAIATAASGFALYVTRPYPDVITKLSFASAWPALVLLSVTLIFGAWRVLRGKTAALSLDLRRDIGIWAGIVGIFHAVIGQCVHMRGRPWLYYIYQHWQAMPVRHDVFGLANQTGLIAAIVLALLLILSNDASLRRLGPVRWKGWQRWNYACFGLAAAHTFLYLLGIESAKIVFIAVAIVCATATVLLQLAGWRRLD